MTLHEAVIDLVRARQEIGKQDRDPKTDDLGDLPDDYLIHLIELFEELGDLALRTFNERRPDEPRWTLGYLEKVRTHIRKAEEASRSDMPVLANIAINHAAAALNEARASALVDAKSNEQLEARRRAASIANKWRRGGAKESDG